VNLLRAALTGFAAVAVAVVAALTPLLAIMLKYSATLRPPVGDGFYVVIHWHAWGCSVCLAIGIRRWFLWQYYRTRWRLSPRVAIGPLGGLHVAISGAVFSLSRRCDGKPSPFPFLFGRSVPATRARPPSTVLKIHSLSL
jgi:hypothetical protein